MPEELSQLGERRNDVVTNLGDQGNRSSGGIHMGSLQDICTRPNSGKEPRNGMGILRRTERGDERGLGDGTLVHTSISREDMYISNP